MANVIDAWSFSRLQCYEECPAKFKYRNIDKLPEPKSEAMQRGIDIHRKCEAFLKGAAMLPEPEMMQFGALFQQLRQLDPIVEQKWGFTRSWQPTGFFSKGVKATWLRVIPDAGVIYDDHTAEIIDFKTGKPWGDNSDQMNLFATAAFCRYPDVKEINVRLWYLDSGDEVEKTYTRKTQQARKDLWEQRIAPMFNDTVFAPRPSKKCRWCAFSRSAGGPCQY